LSDAGACRFGTAGGERLFSDRRAERLSHPERPMTFLSYAYRIVSNFVFLGLVYFTLNVLEQYPQRATVAILLLIYAAMHAFSAVRSYTFFQRVERLEGETRRVASALGEGPNSAASRKQIVADVTGLRHAGEIKSYIDLFFLALVILLCIAKIVTN
jgi:hypothetical protein